MKYKCEKCHDTGSTDKSGEYPDCVACQTAMQRVALMNWLLSECLHQTLAQSAWAIHQRALAMAAAAPQVVAETDSVLETVTELARCTWRDNYKHDAPQWEPLADLHGVLSQIGNMVCGMRRAAPVQAQEPVAESVTDFLLKEAREEVCRLKAKLVIAESRTQVQPGTATGCPSAEDYSDMLRDFFFNYAAGGYNDAGGLVPLETAKDKLEWIVNEAIQHAAPAAQGDAKDEAYEFAAQVIELFDDATMRHDHMLDAGECATVIRALKSTEIAAIAAKAAS